MIKTPHFLIGLLLMTCFALAGCDGERSGGGGHQQADGHDDEFTAATNPNVLAIPSAVRRNLGITFVEVERRRIAQTLRVPGRFEYLPTARREYRTPLPGRVELHVEQFDRVEPGQTLYRLNASAWRELQQQLADTRAQIERSAARLDSFEPMFAAHEEHERSLRQSVTVMAERVERLESVRDAGGGRADEIDQAQASLAGARAELATVLEKQAELAADRTQAGADLRAARARFDYLLDAAAAVVPLIREELLEVDDDSPGDRPRWATIREVEVRATHAGVVEAISVTEGAWVDEKALVLTVVEPDRLRFRASGLQSDLGVLRDGLPASIVPPTPTAGGRAIPLGQTMSGTLSLGTTGNPDDRTVELFVTPDALLPWARPGVSAQLEIVTDQTAAPELAIPLAAVQRDGLNPVIFRRNPENPNEALRVEADLGMDDGRWVALLSGVRDGDQIVLDGAFQLMLATSGSVQKGGHFHADGTWHEGEH
jgi:cobalt-zinc-cadmium efflux system membrane fusion protein